VPDDPIERHATAPLRIRRVAPVRRIGSVAAGQQHAPIEIAVYRLFSTRPSPATNVDKTPQRLGVRPPQRYAAVAMRL